MSQSSWGFLALVLGAAAIGSCSKASDGDGASEVLPNPVVIHVAGMQKGEGGKTWMAWPNSVKTALEGLQGVTKIEMDLKQDLFRAILAETGPPSKEDLFKAIRELGYTPSLADASAFGTTAEPAHPAATEIPPLIQKALDQAKAESKKFVLVDCMGDNWVACLRMSGKTFADPEVKKLIKEHFVFVKLNVDHEKHAAGWFASQAIPDTWILSTDGKILDRVVGFEEPQKFANRLRKQIEGK